MTEARLGPKASEMSWVHKLGRVSWGLIVLTAVIACIGFGMLYSAADGNMEPWASRQIFRFMVGLILVLVIAVVDIRIWMRSAYLIYALALFTLVAVETFGFIGMGAQRWIYLGWFQLQPSELMKIALVMALARYFHSTPLDDARRPILLVVPVLMVLAPIGLVLRQPDLGTAAMLVVGAGAVFFVSGVAIRYFLIGGAIAGLAGAVQVMGRPPTYAVMSGMPQLVNLGFDGIGVAMIGRNHPVGIVVAAVFFGGLMVGGRIMQFDPGVPFELVRVIEGVIIVTLAVPELRRIFSVARRKLSGGG